MKKLRQGEKDVYLQFFFIKKDKYLLLPQNYVVPPTNDQNTRTNYLQITYNYFFSFRPLLLTFFTRFSSSDELIGRCSVADFEDLLLLLNGDDTVTWYQESNFANTNITLTNNIPGDSVRATPLTTYNKYAPLKWRYKYWRKLYSQENMLNRF